MARAVIEVDSSVRDLLRDSRVDMYSDAGQVMSYSDQLTFLLGVWRYVRCTEAGAAAFQVMTGRLGPPKTAGRT